MAGDQVVDRLLAAIWHLLLLDAGELREPLHPVLRRMTSLPQTGRFARGREALKACSVHNAQRPRTGTSEPPRNPKTGVVVTTVRWKCGTEGGAQAGQCQRVLGAGPARTAGAQWQPAVVATSAISPR